MLCFSTLFSTSIFSVITMIRDEENVFFKDWCISYVGGFLDFEDLGRWDVAMSSKRKKWLQGLSNVKIQGIDDYEHRCNESVQWLISRRTQHVSTISFCYKDDAINQICSKTFFGAHVLTNLKSIDLKSCVTDSILDSLKVNCCNLEKLLYVQVDESSSYAAAVRVVQKLPRLRSFAFTGEAPSGQSPKPLVLALAQHCPLLESLDLAEYNDEGLAELVAGCPKLHTLTIKDCDALDVTLAGFRVLGRSRSITTLTLSIDSIREEVLVVLGAMADEGMPIKTLNLCTRSAPSGSADYITGVTRFAQTLENLSLKEFSELRDEHLEVLNQCHKLRSIHLTNFGGGHNYSVSGSFLFPMSAGCPLLEKVFVEIVEREYDPDAPPVQHVNFTPFFKRCPNLKEFNLDIRTDEEVKALTQYCPLVEGVSLGSSDGAVLQEHSEISDDSLVAIAQGLPFLTKVSLNFTRCTDAGLLFFAKGKCSRVLKDFHIHHKSWSQGYVELITKEGANEFHAAMKIR